MMRPNSILLLAAVFALLCSPIARAECELSNEALQAMPMIEVELLVADKSVKKVKARLADNARTRAAGFQRVCASVIEQTPILFLYKQTRIPRFHMNNVVAPIDIAFIKRDGSIDVIHSMKPYFLGSLRKPEYSPNSPIIAALEASPGFFKQWQTDQLLIRWSNETVKANSQ